MERLYMVNGNSDVRGCEWVEGTDWNDNMVCMDNEYFELLQDEYSMTTLECFVYSLPKPLQLIIKPFFNKFIEKM